jgi:hypothetical protein
LVGLASRYCQLVSETIASSEREASEWKMHKLTGFALAFAHLKIDGEGAGVGTYRFLPQAQIGDGSVPEM